MVALVTLMAFQLMVTADHYTYYILEKLTLEITFNLIVVGENTSEGHHLAEIV
jgi:hypothetical protein